MSEFRVGTKVHRTIYQNDKLCGLMDTPELATMVVDALNGVAFESAFAAKLTEFGTVDTLIAEYSASKQDNRRLTEAVAKAKKHIEDAEGGIHMLTVMLESMLRQYRYGVRNAELDNAVDRYFSDKADRR